MTQDNITESRSALNPLILSRGTLLTRDLARARARYEEFLGLECVQIGPKRMLVRDTDPKVLRQRRGGAYWVMDVREVSDKVPTNLFKHWGIDVSSQQDVDRVHSFALANKERLGLTNVRKPRMQHGTYSFYAEDVDGNWWEVECRPPEEATDKVFGRGDAAHWKI
jgi:catechol 2,3-dioxygenase-like lactoylglutathione lyase family enzyme